MIEHTYVYGMKVYMHFWMIKSKQENLSYVTDSSYTRVENAIQLKRNRHFYQIGPYGVAYSWETHSHQETTQITKRNC